MKKITLILLSLMFSGNILMASTTNEVNAFTDVLKNVCGITDYSNYMNATDKNFNGIYTGDIDCGNKGLTDANLSTFKVLKQVTGNWVGLDLQQNSLTKTNGLQNLVSTTYLSLNNNNISDVSDLSSLTTVNNDLFLNDNNLTSLNGLNNLTTVKGNFYMDNNPNLSDITALNNLTSVGATLNISNTDLTNLNGLNNLTSVGGSLYIYNNPNLTSLAGLDNLTTINGFKRIK